MKKIIYTWQDFEDDVKTIIDSLKTRDWVIKEIIAIPKGGLLLGARLANTLKVPLRTDIRDGSLNNHENILVVDDIADSGRTFMDIPKIYTYKTLTLVKKKTSQFVPNLSIRACDEDEWIVFTPWEPENKTMVRDRYNVIELGGMNK